MKAMISVELKINAEDSSIIDRKFLRRFKKDYGLNLINDNGEISEEAISAIVNDYVGSIEEIIEDEIEEEVEIISVEKTFELEDGDCKEVIK